jgi:hypothetical protein
LGSQSRRNQALRCVWKRHDRRLSSSAARICCSSPCHERDAAPYEMWMAGAAERCKHQGRWCRALTSTELIYTPAWHLRDGFVIMTITVRGSQAGLYVVLVLVVSQTAECCYMAAGAHQQLPVSACLCDPTHLLEVKAEEQGVGGQAAEGGGLLQQRLHGVGQAVRQRLRRGVQHLCSRGVRTGPGFMLCWTGLVSILATKPEEVPHNSRCAHTLGRLKPLSRSRPSKHAQSASASCCLRR